MSAVRRPHDAVHEKPSTEGLEAGPRAYRVAMSIRARFGALALGLALALCAACSDDGPPLVSMCAVSVEARWPGHESPLTNCAGVFAGTVQVAAVRVGEVVELRGPEPIRDVRSSDPGVLSEAARSSQRIKFRAIRSGSTQVISNQAECQVEPMAPYGCIALTVQVTA
jgi:hypothetical protein